MSKLAELVKKRGSYKGRLTKFENYVDNLKISDCSKVDKLELKLRMSKIESIYSDYDEIQMAIECFSLSEEEHQNQCLHRSDFESQYFSVMARAQNLCGEFKKREKSFSHGDDASVCSDSSANSDQDSTVRVKQSKSGVRGVKLPTIHIPKYSGDYGTWLEFRDTFLSLIHENPNISSIQKFHYLRASLEGSAAQIIHALEFSASNYCLAWNALCERYDNTRLLVQNHIKAIFDLTPIKKESATSLRSLMDIYNKNLRALHILGEPTGTWDTLIIFIICQKLDSRTLRDWEEHKATHKQINLEIFTKFLKNKADLLETIENNNAKPDTTSRSNLISI